VTVRRIDAFNIVLEGISPVAEAEVLRQLLVSAKTATVDWRDGMRRMATKFHPELVTP